MRIVNRAEFRALEHEVLFTKIWENRTDDTLYIGTGACGDNDFVSISLAPESLIANTGSDDLWDKVESLRKDPNLSLPTEYDGTGRDGSYEGDEVRFLIFEQDDVDGLIMRLVEVRQSMKKATGL